jgi:hypothetical protein
MQSLLFATKVEKKGVGVKIVIADIARDREGKNLQRRRGDTEKSLGPKRPSESKVDDESPHHRLR